MHCTLHPLAIGSLSETFPFWLQSRSYSAFFLICDANTERHCAPVFFEKTGLPADKPRVVIAPGELEKHLGTCQEIWSAMFAAQLDRKALVINLGGGVIGDMGGFCAATYKRGIDFVQVPTTLLSATDASVGGKLGIDYQGIKNAVGVFQNPAGVFLDTDFFETLDPRELRSGFAEVAKHALIGAPALWAELRGLTTLEHVDWTKTLEASVAVKVTVVEQDPLEKGLRALLNYGHTIGHALESYYLDSDHPLTHGEAIAWGMVAESRLQERFTDTRGMVGSAELEAYFDRFYPKRTLPATAVGAIWELMQQDKKNSTGRIRMSLPGAGPLELVWVEPTLEMVAAVLN
jgi:3-dehydroquinate synthase